MKLVKEPCYFVETLYLLHNFVNRLTYEEQYMQVSKNFNRHYYEKDCDPHMEHVRELDRIAAAVTAELNPEDPQLRRFFAAFSGAAKGETCCLAQVMLLTVPFYLSDVDDFAAQLLLGREETFRRGFKINGLTQLGLDLAPLEDGEQARPLAAQLEDLPCNVESRWAILRALTEYETHLAALTALIRPAAARLCREAAPLIERNRTALQEWSGYFESHTVEEYQHEIFNTPYLFTPRKEKQELLLGIWNFNCFSTWTEQLDNLGLGVYIGAEIGFDFAAGKRISPKADTLCGMLRTLGSRDKLEILRLCAEAPHSAARLAAEMSLNSGSVSRNLYSLYRFGFLETREDSDRVLYVTRPDALEQLFRDLSKYVQNQ